MANKTFNTIKNVVQKGAEHVDVNAIKEKASTAASTIGGKAVEIKDAAVAAKDDIAEKLTELDRMLESSVTEYNDAYTLMNDKGMKLYVERCRTVDIISIVENLINSIANHPKSFDSEFEDIKINRNSFVESCEFANRELESARIAAGGAGAGLAAGTSVAFMAPTAAMWIATTFGTASTGTAISALSGAAATNAALAWLGGGAITAGGGGIVAGNAFLALAGPIGWGIAGASLLGSIILFANKRTKLNKEKNEEIEKIKRNIELVKEMDVKILDILSKTSTTRESLMDVYMKAAVNHGANYSNLDDANKQMLASIVNLTKTLSMFLGETISE